MPTVRSRAVLLLVLVICRPSGAWAQAREDGCGEASEGAGGERGEKRAEKEAAGPETEAASPAKLTAGAASVDITPPPGLPLWGYASRRDSPATGARDRLEASAVVFGNGKRRIALVGLDLGRGPARDTQRAIEERVRESAGVETLFLVGSHTHHGPCLELETVEPTASWIRELEERVAGVIAEAARKARPAKLAVISAEVDENRNRHSHIEPVPVDRSIHLLSFVDFEGRPIAVVVNYGAHPTTLPASVMEYSADWPGYLRRYVEEKVGGTCVFLQGAVGDLSCRRAGRDTRGYGEDLGKEVVALVEKSHPEALPSPSILARDEELRFDARVRVDEPVRYALYCLAFFKDLVDAYVKEYAGGVIRPRLTVALLDGRIGFVGTSGELFCAHAMRLRERARLEHLFVFSCTNGYHQYLPTIEATAEGGYGADDRVSPIEVGAGERIMDRALIDLYEMRHEMRRERGER